MTPNVSLVQPWIHSFSVTETMKHKQGGYTIYKITSIVFPRSKPQALTCLTVWKRFHDIKRLHRELCRRHKNLQLPGKLPEPTDSTFFKRFDPVVIERRKIYILELLDFVAQHAALYKCHAFTQFFSDAQSILSPTGTPQHELTNCDTKKVVAIRRRGGGEGGGSLADIYERLDLHGSGFSLLDSICDKAAPNADKNDATKTKTFLPKTPKQMQGQQQQELQTEEENVENKDENDEKEHVDEDETILLDQDIGLLPEKPCKDYARFLTPMASIESDDSDYIYEAALKFSHAVQAEANLEYKEAYERYKRGVEVLLNGCKDDCNEERKFIAKGKIAKYLARAEDIYNKFLCDDAAISASSAKMNFQLTVDITDSGNGSCPGLYLERPWNNLAKYKVLQVLGDRVMQVQCITEPQRPTYVIKGIEKPSSNSPTQTIFLPRQVPYMVDLLAFFQSDQKIFLLLKQAEGGQLFEYMQTYTPTVMGGKTKNLSSLFPDVSAAAADADSACDNSNLSVQDSGCVDCSPTPSIETNLMSSESTDFNELVRCSQQLLQSVSNTLKEVRALEQHAPIENKDDAAENKDDADATSACEPNKETDNLEQTVNKSRAKIPEASLKQWARELAVAIHSLHEKSVILGDLHMENLLLGAKGQLLLSYFYQNECDDAEVNCMSRNCSLLAVEGHFCAPEKPITFKSDWWSYGVVLYQLLLNLPFKAAHPGNIELYGSVQFPEDAELSTSARDLLENLLQQAPEDRFDFEQIRVHPFFAGTDWEEMKINGLNNKNNIKNKAAKSIVD